MIWALRIGIAFWWVANAFILSLALWWHSWGMAAWCVMLALMEIRYEKRVRRRP